MAFLRFFDSAKAIGFAKSVVDEFCAIDALNDSSKKHAGRKADRLSALIRKVSGYTKAESISVYVRARMLSEIKDGLKSRNIDADAIEDFVRAILVKELK
jgi:hypothetical protein